MSTTASGTETSTRPAVDRRVLIAHVVTLAVAGVAILWYARHQWFVTDEWDPIARRAVFGHARLGLLDPHNEHWSTIAIVVYRVQVALFGLRTYFPVMAVFTALHLVAAHLIWRVMLRVRVDALVATALVAV